MVPAHCRVLARTHDAESDHAGTVGIDRGRDETLRLTTTGSDLELTAVLPREAALALLLSAADALGMVVFDPKDAARRTAKARQRRA